MLKYLRLIFVLFVLNACKTEDVDTTTAELNLEDYDLTIAFGSCNKQNKKNRLWDDVLKNNPEVWIWAGDNIYGDTDDMQILRQKYTQQKNQDGYAALEANTRVLGTWDDHDYGKNDAGLEFAKKKESQHLFLDFLNVSQNDERRNREGVYHSTIIPAKNGQVKIIVLDTRYHRTALKDSKKQGSRYQPNDYGKGTILGETQWAWLETELQQSDSDFNIIVSSIQFLSSEHGFEKWANFPHEVDRMVKLLEGSNARNVLFISGDRHISEFSKMNADNLDYPVIDFTSSGLTHSYSNFKTEPNVYRNGKVISYLSFGLLHFNFKTKEVKMQMRGDENMLQQELIQSY